MYNEGLVDKSLFTNAYQLILRESFPEEEFNIRRAHPIPKRGDDQHPRKLTGLFSLPKGSSPKYFVKKAIKHIRNRNQVFQRTMHKSLSKWKADKRFIELITDLRKDGWLDWQILMALQNFALSYKVRFYFKYIQFPSEEIYIKNFSQETYRKRPGRF